LQRYCSSSALCSQLSVLCALGSALCALRFVLCALSFVRSVIANSQPRSAWNSQYQWSILLPLTPLWIRRNHRPAHPWTTRINELLEICLFSHPCSKAQRSSRKPELTEDAFIVLVIGILQLPSGRMRECSAQAASMRHLRLLGTDCFCPHRWRRSRLTSAISPNISRVSVLPLTPENSR